MKESALIRYVRDNPRVGLARCCLVLCVWLAVFSLLGLIQRSFYSAETRQSMAASSKMISLALEHPYLSILPNLLVCAWLACTSYLFYQARPMAIPSLRGIVYLFVIASVAALAAVASDMWSRFPSPVLIVFLAGWAAVVFIWCYWTRKLFRFLGSDHVQRSVSS